MTSGEGNGSVSALIADWEDARGAIAARDFARATEILERVSEAV